MGGAGLGRVALVPAIQGYAEPLALFDDQGIVVTSVRFDFGCGPTLGLAVREEQQVRDVFVTSSPLLRQVVGPPQEFQYRTDQLLLRHRFVRVLEPPEGLVTVKDVTSEMPKRLRPGDGSFPFGGGPDALGEEVMGEQLAGHDRSSASKPVRNLEQGHMLAPSYVLR